MPMESRISCPLCGDILPVPENAQEITCPHCAAHIPFPCGETVPTAVSMCGEPPAAASTMTVPTITSAPSPPADTPQSAPTPRAGKLKTFFIAAACAVGMIGLIVLGIATVPSSPASAPDTAAPSPSSSATTPTTSDDTASPEAACRKLIDETFNLIANYAEKSNYTVHQQIKFSYTGGIFYSTWSKCSYDIYVLNHEIGDVTYYFDSQNHVRRCSVYTHAATVDDATLCARIAYATILPSINTQGNTPYSLKSFEACLESKAQHETFQDGTGRVVTKGFINLDNCTFEEEVKYEDVYYKFKTYMAAYTPGYEQPK